MTRRERAVFFNRLCVMREAYAHLDEEDRIGTTTICEALVDAELELELIAIEAEIRAGDGSASSLDRAG